jgi:hypothetical protein
MQWVKGGKVIRISAEGGGGEADLASLREWRGDGGLGSNGFNVD